MRERDPSPIHPPFNQELLSFLVCPVSKTDLVYDPEHQELLSYAANLAYPIRNGIPVMLTEQARPIQKEPQG